MEELKYTELTQTKRKTTSNIKTNNILISNSKPKINFLSNINLDDLLNDYEELNGINFTEKYFKRRVKSRRSFVSKIPSVDKKININVGKKYPNFTSKLLFWNTQNLFYYWYIKI